MIAQNNPSIDLAILASGASAAVQGQPSASSNGQGQGFGNLLAQCALSPLSAEKERPKESAQASCEEKEDPEPADLILELCLPTQITATVDSTRSSSDDSILEKVGTLSAENVTPLKTMPPLLEHASASPSALDALNASERQQAALISFGSATSSAPTLSASAKTQLIESMTPRLIESIENFRDTQKPAANLMVTLNGGSQLMVRFKMQAGSIKVSFGTGASVIKDHIQREWSALTQKASLRGIHLQSPTFENRLELPKNASASRRSTKSQEESSWQS